MRRSFGEGDRESDLQSWEQPHHPATASSYHAPLSSWEAACPTPELPSEREPGWREASGSHRQLQWDGRTVAALCERR